MNISKSISALFEQVEADDPILDELNELGFGDIASQLGDSEAETPLVDILRDLEIQRTEVEDNEDFDPVPFSRAKTLIKKAYK